MLNTILLIASCVCFFLAAFGVGSKINLGWLGLALWILTLLI